MREHIPLYAQNNKKETEAEAEKEGSETESERIQFDEVELSYPHYFRRKSLLAR